MKEQLTIGDRFEGVLLETAHDGKVSRPRVRPLEYFDKDIKVEFPRNLRENNPIGTRFRADIKVSQKTKNGELYGNPYLVATDSSIVKVENFSPKKTIKAVKINTVSDRVYEYIEQDLDIKSDLVSFNDFRTNVYKNAIDAPQILKSSTYKVKRSQLIQTYAHIRACGKCEGCENEAPFLKKNGEPYLEVHHIVELKNGGSDSPLNVIAICPNCHARVTYGFDGEEFNQRFKTKVEHIENLLNKE